MSERLTTPPAPVTPITANARNADLALLTRACRDDRRAIATMFARFVPADETIVAVEYLGSRGVRKFATHSFACVTDRRVGLLQATGFGEMLYEDGLLSEANSGRIRQPSRLGLGLWVAVVFVVLFYVNGSGLGAVGGLIVAALMSVLLLPVIIRLYYRVSKPGLMLWIGEGPRLSVFSDRQRLRRTAAVYRAALAMRERALRGGEPPTADGLLPAGTSNGAHTTRLLHFLSRRDAIIAIAFLALVLFVPATVIAMRFDHDDDGSPASTSASAPSSARSAAPAASLTDDQQQLAGYAGSAVHDCASADPATLLQRGNATAAISCKLAGADQLYYFLYDDETAMLREYRIDTDDLPRGDCGVAGWDSRTTWRYGNDPPSGRLACWDADIGAVIKWTDRPRLIYGVMLRKDGDHRKLNRAWGKAF